MIKRYLDSMRRRFPRLWRTLRSVKYPNQALGRAETVFTRIHAENFWEAGESRSGPGSTLSQTEALRAELPALFRELGIQSLLDVPCGDYNWMGRLEYEFDAYTGGDIVKSVVAENQERFTTPKRRFVHLDLMRDDLPDADAILCRDCLVHFSDGDVRKALLNVARSGARFFVATTYPGAGESRNIITGEWQPLDLEAAPFRLPSPLRVVSEKHVEPDGSPSLKSLGVWRLDDLRNAMRT